VSVIIPVYNRESHIEKCINSVMKQTHKNLQIIIVDDGSTDATAKICDELENKDNRIAVIHQENSGLCASRNKGLALAQGSYICFVDSDDYIDTRFVELLLGAAVNNDAFLSQCRTMQIVSEKEYAAPESLVDNKALNMEMFFLVTAYSKDYGVLSPCDKLYHRSLFLDLRFDESSKHALDLVTVCELIYKAGDKRLVITNQVLYYRLRHDGNMSEDFQTISRSEQEHGFRITMDFWKDKGMPEVYEYFRWIYLRFCINRVVPFSILFYREVNEFTQVVISRIKDLVTQNGLHHFFSLPMASIGLWDGICKGSNLAVYGFGKSGSRFVYPWLKHFGIPVAEIWDISAELRTEIDGIPVCKAHEELDKDILIVITIQDKLIAAKVKMDLRKLGYRKFYMYEQVEPAIRYAIYKNYMPFLL